MKVLRLPGITGNNNINGWDTSTQYTDANINDIVDPNGNKASKQITSIPSPFARIDLVKTAFTEVSKRDGSGGYPNVNGDDIFNKMVSDSLDVGEIFFRYGQFKNQVEIIVWDRQANLDELLNSDSPEYQQFGKTLELYLEQDAQTYNFTNWDRVYLLNYIDGPDPINIIGATSPRTLFFSNANDLNYVDITINNDKKFDNIYCPLYERDIEYHKYLWALKHTIQNFATLFPEFDAYLMACYTMSDRNRQAELRNSTNFDNELSDIAINGHQGNLVQVLGNNLKQKIKTIVSGQSDFEIKPTIYQGNNKLPLVLPIDDSHAYQSWNYDGAKWSKNIITPYYDNNLLENRSLPSCQIMHPYLTISDFLEDTLIQLNDSPEFNKQSFVTAGIEKADTECSYLLPIKPLYFRYFGTADLDQNFTMKKISGGVTATLKISTKRGIIEYTRTYFHDTIADIDHNKGGIRKRKLYFAMLPLVRFRQDDLANYNMNLMYEYNELDNYSLYCMKGSSQLEMSCDERNVQDQNHKKEKMYSLKGSNFDYIQVCCHDDYGIIIPRFKQDNGADEYTFAIDLGTTNTHIEYTVNNGKTPQKFFIGEKDIQLNLLASGYEDLVRNQFYVDMMPEIVGENGMYKFPMRTSLSYKKDLDWQNTQAMPYMQANVAFTYEKIVTWEEYNRIDTNLKWASDNDNQRKIKIYIESLFILLRNKVILNGGDLTKTKIVWFYPISMKQGRFNLFQAEWESAYRNYFGDNTNNVIPMTESIAPYKALIGGNSDNTVTIDIGGGTTDVAFGDGENVKYITSFRFAANSIFGEPYSGTHLTQHSGIILQFKDEIRSVLEKNNQNRLMEVFDNIDQSRDSANMASFLFSLPNNVQESECKDLVNFNDILSRDSSQKIVFLLFYTAIIYHIANIMKVKGLRMPRDMAFSGTGSKVISVLTKDDGLLSRYTQEIFENVYGENYRKEGLLINRSRDFTPKESTCKGGLLNPIKQRYEDVDNMRLVLKAGDNQIANGDTYAIYTEEYKKEVLNNVEKFLGYALEKMDQFKDNFNIDKKFVKIAKDGCLFDLDTYLRKGLEQKNADLDDKIEETSFFYPLCGVLSALSRKIYDESNNKQTTDAN